MVWVIVFIVISRIVGMGSLGIGRSVLVEAAFRPISLPHSYRHGPRAKPDIPQKGLGETGGAFVVNVVLRAEQHCVGTDALSSSLSNPSLECQSTHESAD